MGLRPTLRNIKRSKNLPEKLLGSIFKKATFGVTVRFFGAEQLTGRQYNRATVRWRKLRWYTVGIYREDIFLFGVHANLGWLLYALLMYPLFKIFA